MFKKALETYEASGVRARLHASFTAIKNKTLQRCVGRCCADSLRQHVAPRSFGYELQVHDQPYRAYHDAILHLIAVISSVKDALSHLRVSMTGETGPRAESAPSEPHPAPQRPQRAQSW